MKNLWIRFGCFLIGYNYNIVKNSSEVTAKAVKRYTSAMIIICLLWIFVGFTFTARYLNGGLWGSIAGAIVGCIFIIQIERQIILAVTKNRWLYFFRGIIALLMAIIGALVIDQIIFKDDIEQKKIVVRQDKVDQVMPAKSNVLKQQIQALEADIRAKEVDRVNLIDDITKNKTITIYSTNTVMETHTVKSYDSLGKEISNSQQRPRTVPSSTSIPNPKMALLAPLDKQIAELHQEKLLRGNRLMSLRDTIEAEFESKVGFLDELDVMYTLVKESKVALGVWLIWIILLLSLELLVLMSKAGDKRNDYDETINHQLELQLRKLQLLAGNAK